MKEHTTWAEAERIFWAVTDENGHPVEMPQNRIHQIWNTYGKIEEKDFELQAFHGGGKSPMIYCFLQYVHFTAGL